MLIEINGQSFELSTKLRAIQKIENEFKAGVDSIFQMLGSARTSELVRIIQLAAQKDDEPAVKEGILEHWDYMDLVMAVSELLINMLFSGTPEQKEKKLDRFPADEESKNEIREMLGLPVKALSEKTED